MIKQLKIYRLAEKIMNLAKSEGKTVSYDGALGESKRFYETKPWGRLRFTHIGTNEVARALYQNLI